MLLKCRYKVKRIGLKKWLKGLQRAQKSNYVAYRTATRSLSRRAYNDKKNSQTPADKPMRICAVSRRAQASIMDILVALGLILAAAVVIVWITKPR